MTREAGTLSIVATPIGHLDDITLRALRTLTEADAILAEDTRHTRRLLNHHGIKTRLRSLHANTPASTVTKLAGELEAGRHFALVTDAGTPMISDPGGALVAADGWEHARFRERPLVLGADAVSADAFVLAHEAALVARLAHGGGPARRRAGPAARRPGGAGADLRHAGEQHRAS